jgi:hypothetical protein
MTIQDDVQLNASRPLASLMTLLPSDSGAEVIYLGVSEMNLKPFFALLSAGFFISCAAQQTSSTAPAISSTVVVVGTPQSITLGESNRSVVVMETQKHPLAFQTVEDRLRTDASTYIEQRGAGEHRRTSPFAGHPLSRRSFSSMACGSTMSRPRTIILICPYR